MVEPLIQERKARITEWIKQNHKEVLNESGEVNRHVLFGGKIAEMEMWGLEWLFWDWLEADRYWNSFHHLEEMCKRDGEIPFSDDELAQVTGIMFRQIIEGKAVTGDIPLYSDVWEFLDSEATPLRKHLTDEQRSFAVNEGFWRFLGEEDQYKRTSAGGRLGRVIRYDHFYRFFDFEKGAERAAEMPEHIRLHSDFNEWELYMRWFLVQEVYIERKHGQKAATPLRGRLAAPLVRHLFFLDDAEGDILKKLVSVYMRGDVLQTEPVQKVLGEVFEYELEIALESPMGEFSPTNIKTCSKCLVDREPHVKAVWEEVKDRVDVFEVEPAYKKFVPKEAYAAKVAELKGKMEALRRLDVGLYTTWTGLETGVEVSKFQQGRIRNKAHEVYFAQTQRPSGRDLELMTRLGFQGSKNEGDKVRGFLFADMVYRKRWSAANNVLRGYDNLPQKPKRVFFEAVREYVERHGRIRIAAEGLYTNAAYPAYNKILDFHRRFPDLFEAVK